MHIGNTVRLAFFALFSTPTAFAFSGVSTSLGTYNETHPYQAKLVCERANTAILTGILYDVGSGNRVQVGTYNFGNIGACEFAVRASRNNIVCIEDSYTYYSYNLTNRTRGQSFGSDFNACIAFTRRSPTLRSTAGFVEFIPPAEMAPFISVLPTLSSAEFDGVLKSSRTMWYDESSLTFVYQDSFGDPRGLRANRVGYDVGSTNEEIPDIHTLVDFFNPGKFKFPFSIAAGADFTQNVYVLNFWQPPQRGSQVVPVKVWRNNSHWQWVFPANTYIGEILFLRAPDGAWLPFEVRARKRALDHWETFVWRPFTSAVHLSTTIKTLRPNWQQTDLRALIAALDNSANLVAQTVSTAPYTSVVPNITGALESLPGTTDGALIRTLLTNHPFVLANGQEWKRSNNLVTYAPTTNSDFHIVPKGYTGGLLEVSNASCRRCHDQTSRPLNNLDSRIVLYGEIWGEDEIFTWHPFAVDFETFGVADGNRRLNPRLQQAGLVQDGLEPAAGDAWYRVLPKPYTPEYE